MVLLISNMKRLNIFFAMGSGCIFFMLSLFVFRGQADLPDISEGNLFCDYESPSTDGMVEIRMHSLGDKQKWFKSAGVVGNDLDVYDGAESGFGKRKNSSFSSPINLDSNTRKRYNVANKDAGLFGSESKEPFSSTGLEQPKVVSWGWLADEVKRSEQNVLNRDDVRFGSQRETRRIFDDDSGLGSGFGLDNNSGEKAYFRHQNLSW